MKFLVLILTLAACGMAKAQTISCKQAMDNAVGKNSPSFTYQTLAITPVGIEQMVEVTALVNGWRPNSDTASGYYYLVSATCKASADAPYSSQIDDLVLYDFPGEGGVTVKTITKQRF